MREYLRYADVLALLGHRRLVRMAMQRDGIRPVYRRHGWFYLAEQVRPLLGGAR
jgi:hypothetical protein